MNDDIKKLFEEAVIGIEEFIDYDMGRGLYQKAHEQGSESQQAKIDNGKEWNKRLKAKIDQLEEQSTHDRIRLDWFDKEKRNDIDIITELEKKYQNDPATIQLLECTDKCIELERQRDELRGILKDMQYNGCICGIGIGNPMYSTHSKLCERVTNALSYIKDGE